MKTLTKRGYARHRLEAGLPGGTPAAVREALARGRITLEPDGGIDPRKADAAWKRNTKERAIPSPATKAEAARFIAAKARKAELEVEQLRAGLISVADVEREAARIRVMVAAVLKPFPARMAPILVGMTDRHAIAELLDTEVRELLAQMRAGLDAK